MAYQVTNLLRTAVALQGFEWQLSNSRIGSIVWHTVSVNTYLVFFLPRIHVAFKCLVLGVLDFSTFSMSGIISYFFLLLSWCNSPQ